jgi:molecular chaperone DnaK (HSP70)
MAAFEVTVDGEKRQYLPEEVLSMVIKKVKSSAERSLGEKVKHAVITWPGYFNDFMRVAMRRASVLAGLNVLRAKREPTATIVAYGFDKQLRDEPNNVLVFGLGGGTLDVTVLSFFDGHYDVVATASDLHLGGDQFDERVVADALRLFQLSSNKDASTDQRAVARLRDKCERAKRVLSKQGEVNIEVDDFFDGENLVQTLTRARFEQLNVDLFMRTLGCVEQALSDAKLLKYEIDEVVLVGGSTNIPRLQQLITEFFDGKKPNNGINCDEVIAYGATQQALEYMVNDDQRRHGCGAHDVTPLSLGIETPGGLMTVIIPRNTVVPTKKSLVMSTVEV